MKWTVQRTIKKKAKQKKKMKNGSHYNETNNQGGRKMYAVG